MGRRQATVMLVLVVASWIANACGGTVEKSGSDSGGSGGSGANPGVGGVSGTGGGPVNTGGANGSLGASGVGGSGAVGALGSGGTIGSPGSMACGRALCQPADVPPSLPAFPACCPEPRPGDLPGAAGCGVDMNAFSLVGYRFDPVCQRRNQPGISDPACPDIELFSQGTMATIQEGCCRPEVGVCGIRMDVVAGATMGLGCISSDPFSFEAPLLCSVVRRSNSMSCICGDGSSHVFCVSTGCDDFGEQDRLCHQACEQLGGSAGWDCSVYDPICM